MGANIEFLSSRMEYGEKVKNIKIKNGPLNPIKIGHEHIPSIIDEIPILSIVASQANGKTEIRGAKELRVKESDRVQAIVYNLRNMGVSIEEHNDGFSIFGPVKLKGSKIKTFNDHRIAMAFSIAGLIADGETVLDNKKCVDVSFPNFFNMLQSNIK
jgi:3-phosphoshikimate 1-carboxyvinyltransferase